MAKKIGHLLDENGAEWDCAEDENGMLFFQQDMDGLVWSITLHRNGSIECGGRSLAPEQAVETVLGRTRDGVSAERNGTVTVIENHGGGYRLWRIGSEYYRQGRKADFCETYDTIEEAVEAAGWRGSCDIEEHDNLAETQGQGDAWLECSACHWQAPIGLALAGALRYCPSCGRRNHAADGQATGMR